MYGNDVYLEAASRTQELLNIKWTLRSAGFSIGSTWHDGEACIWSPFKDHWNPKSVEQLRACDLLIVICGNNDGTTPELAMTAGFALARGLQVIWIGPPVAGLNTFRAVRQFNTAEEYRKQIIEEMYSHSVLNAGRLAA